MPKVSALDTLFRSPQEKKKRIGRGHGLLATITIDGTKNCPYCGRTMDRNGPPKLRPTKDHFLPKSCGHKLHPHNKVICCQECNGKKGNLSIFDWVKILRRSREPLDRIRVVRVTHFIEHRQRNGLPVDYGVETVEVVTTC